MRKRMIMPILLGLTLILSMFISTASTVQKIAYAQARTQTSNNGVPFQNSMNPASAVLGSNGGSGRNSAVQDVTGAVSSLHGSPGVGTSPTIHTIATNVAAAINQAKKIISGDTTAIGIFLLGVGVFKIRQHVLAPNQHPIQGIIQDIHKHLP